MVTLVRTADGSRARTALLSIAVAVQAISPLAVQETPGPKYPMEVRYNLPVRTRDGSDIIDWIVKQRWSNGKVATHGESYSGKTQWMLAKENNPHHAAIVSYVSPADDFRDQMRYNGVPKLDLYIMLGGPRPARDNFLYFLPVKNEWRSAQVRLVR